MKWKFVIIILLIVFDNSIFAQRGAGRLGRGRGHRRNYSGKQPTIIQHRSPEAITYYDHKDGAKIVKSSHFEFDYMLGRKITFFCMARGYPKPEITWFKDGIELYQHKYFQVTNSAILLLLTSVGHFNFITSSLTVFSVQGSRMDNRQ